LAHVRDETIDQGRQTIEVGKAKIKILKKFKKSNISSRVLKDLFTSVSRDWTSESDSGTSI